MEDNNKNALYCSHCGALIEDEDYEEVQGEVVCMTSSRETPKKLLYFLISFSVGFGIRPSHRPSFLR